MKNAKELKAIAQEAIETANKNRKKRAIKYVDTEIAPYLERMARNGNVVAFFNIDYEIDIESVIEYLVENEFVVCSTGWNIEVHW